MPPPRRRTPVENAITRLSKLAVSASPAFMAKTTKDTIAAWQNYGGNEQAHHHTTQLRAALVAELAIAETLAVDVERVVARQTLAWTEALRAACKAADEALDALL